MDTESGSLASRMASASLLKLEWALMSKELGNRHSHSYREEKAEQTENVWLNDVFVRDYR